MKLGAEPKKIAVLAGLLGVAAYFFFFSGPDDPASASRTPAAAALPAARPSAGPAGGEAAAAPVRPASSRSSSARGMIQEFRPTLKFKERPDPITIDPTLRLQLLSRLQSVQLEGGQRSLFEFSQPPPPKDPEPKIVPNPKETAKAAPAETTAAAAAAAAAAKPAAPPIPLKFYGFISPVRQGVKRAFFLDGEDILVGSEGEIMKKRYKVVRIGVNSVVVEDVEHKNEQTLPLVEEHAG